MLLETDCIVCQIQLGQLVVYVIVAIDVFTEKIIHVGKKLLHIQLDDSIAILKAG